MTQRQGNPRTRTIAFVLKLASRDCCRCCVPFKFRVRSIWHSLSQNGPKTARDKGSGNARIARYETGKSANEGGRWCCVEGQNDCSMGTPCDLLLNRMVAESAPKRYSVFLNSRGLFDFQDRPDKQVGFHRTALARITVPFLLSVVKTPY